MKENTLNIREATKEDVSKIIPIWRELMDFHAQRDIHFTLCNDAEKAFAAYMLENIDKVDAYLFVAENTTTLVSYCLCTIDKRPPVCEFNPEYGILSELAVLDDYRRQGLGEKMVERAMEWFRSKGIARIEVRVAVTNEVSTQFWRKMGFSTYLETMSKQVELPQGNRMKKSPQGGML